MFKIGCIYSSKSSTCHYLQSRLNIKSFLFKVNGMLNILTDFEIFHSRIKIYLMYLM
jgi:hypothetical protein